jgi:hypothetical protein
MTGMKKLLVSLSAACLFLGSTVLSVTPAQAQPASDSVTLTAPTAQDDFFDAIATWDPIHQEACLYSSETVKPPATSEEPWVTKGNCKIWKPEPGTLSGIYVATWDSGKSKALLTISNSPAASSTSGSGLAGRMLIIVPDFTWQAYNLVKNGSFYFEEVGKKSENFSARKLNLLRPLDFHTVGDPIDYPSAAQLYPFANPIQFLRSHFKDVDVVAQSAIDEYSYGLSKYQTLVLYGHDEYWTAKLRNEIDSAVANGTSLLNLSGNTGYRKLVREGDVIGFEKPTAENPKTSIWGELKGDTSPLKLLGVSYLGEPLGKRQVKPVRLTKRLVKELHGEGFPRAIPRTKILEASFGMLVKDGNDPLFKNTKLRTGDFFGQSSKVVSIEIDGIPEVANGDIDGAFLRQFGNTPLSAAAEIWTNGRKQDATAHWRAGTLIRTSFGRGKVFSAGPIGWAHSIAVDDPDVRQITINALKYLGQEPIR